jgi:Raf kinase inhibitor-like YbhB/YbcL family protein
VPVAWTGIPDDAVSVALEVHDPDAVAPGGFLHWMVFNLPPEDGSVPPLPDGAEQGKNGLDQEQWLGPCPPPGDPPHNYTFTVYALDKEVDSRDDLAAATIEKGVLTGTYDR